jgi:uncharacterized membrane protein (Fun14 family)
MSIADSFGPAAATIGGGFFAGILIGYALKKVIKIPAALFGLFIAVCQLDLLLDLSKDDMREQSK